MDFRIKIKKDLCYIPKSDFHLSFYFLYWSVWNFHEIYCGITLSTRQGRFSCEQINLNIEHGIENHNEIIEQNWGRATGFEK